MPAIAGLWRGHPTARWPGAQPASGGTVERVESGECTLWSWDTTASSAPPAHVLGRVWKADRRQTAEEVAAHVHAGLSMAGLHGEFAFAMPAGDGVLLGRDPFGTRPLFWTRVPGGVAWASEAAMLFPVLEHPPTGNPRQFAARMRNDTSDPIETWWHGIHRCPAGTLLHLDRHRAKATRFWSPHQVQADQRMSWNDAVEGARDRFEASVGRTFDGCSDPALFLSGGLDSGSIACMATRLGVRFRPYSLRYPAFPELDESGRIRTLTGRLGLRTHWIDADVDNTAARQDRLERSQGFPFWQPVAGTLIQQMEVARAHGHQHVITGTMGDGVVGHGWFAGVRPWRRGNLLQAWSIGRQLQALPASTRWRFRRHVVAAARRGLTDETWQRDQLSSGAWERTKDSFWQAGEGAVESFTPFADRDFLEHCLRVPARHRVRGGRVRAFFVEAVQDIFPEAAAVTNAKQDVRRWNLAVIRRRALEAMP